MMFIVSQRRSMGNTPAHELFDRITIKRADENKPARSFTDYTVTINENGLSEKKVKLIRKIG
jgi:CRISPR-associated protein Csd2